MLMDILKIFSKENYISRSRMAEELNVRKETIDDGISQLLQMGYLLENKTSKNCSTVCNNCPFVKTCNKGIVKTFKISDKGYQVLRSQSL
ncbi:MAG: HTH domain-containing protein [Firmicutes bacterium]|jgi:hypothetical protein|nr:HTH domain-containing protein [Bacillota bacterium]